MELDDTSALDIVIVPPTHDLGDGFKVRRALPSRERRMVGPFVFLDQMGPHVFNAGTGSALNAAGGCRERRSPAR